MGNATEAAVLRASIERRLRRRRAVRRGPPVRPRDPHRRLDLRPRSSARPRAGAVAVCCSTAGRPTTDAAAALRRTSRRCSGSTHRRTLRVYLVPVREVSTYVSRLRQRAASQPPAPRGSALRPIIAIDRWSASARACGDRSRQAQCPPRRLGRAPANTLPPWTWTWSSSAPGVRCRPRGARPPACSPGSAGTGCCSTAARARSARCSARPGWSRSTSSSSPTCTPTTTSASRAC